MGQRSQRVKVKKPVVWDKDTLIGQKKKKIVITTIWIYKTRDAHCSCSPLADFCPASSWETPGQFPPGYVLGRVEWSGIFLWPGWVSYPSCVHSPPSVPPLQPAESWKVLDSVKAAQHQHKLQCVLSITLFLNPKHATGAATRRNINSIPHKSSTVLQLGQLPTETGFAAVGDYNLRAEIPKCLKDCDFLKKTATIHGKSVWQICAVPGYKCCTQNFQMLTGAAAQQLQQLPSSHLYSRFWGLWGIFPQEKKDFFF